MVRMLARSTLIGFSHFGNVMSSSAAFTMNIHVQTIYMYMPTYRIARNIGGN